MYRPEIGLHKKRNKMNNKVNLYQDIIIEL